ncbi:hypothetical protein Vafri_22262 [Volvox africanus]|uniref:Uncharacterized protein n=1 Tax=Volvox africanus TaxID=51714 RepID=A0A8J4F2M4_9CHLO|nr:hypothetical protein Vafri_12394 [Volvox africanus]GIL68968.1 hypothetical protein Vafri_22262 [Volvox africanus]
MVLETVHVTSPGIAAAAAAAAGDVAGNRCRCTAHSTVGACNWSGYTGGEVYDSNSVWDLATGACMAGRCTTVIQCGTLQQELVWQEGIIPQGTVRTSCPGAGALGADAGALVLTLVL